MGIRVERGAMRHRRMAVACLFAPICLLSACDGVSAARSLGAPQQSASSAGTSHATLTSEASRLATSPVRPPSDDSASENAVTGEWVLQQVQIGNGLPRSARPGQTNLSIQRGILFTVDACAQQLQAQLTVDRSTLTLSGVIFGGGFHGSPDHPCGDPEAVDFWNNRTTFEWKVVQSRLVVRSESTTLIYKTG